MSSRYTNYIYHSRTLIIEGSGSVKINALLNSITYQPGIDKTCLYIKDPYEAKYQLLINKRKSVRLKHCSDPNAFIEYSNDMDNIYEKTDKYNPNKKRKILIYVMM